MARLTRTSRINFKIPPGFKLWVPFLVFVTSLAFIWFVINNITNIRFVSAINLGLFSFFLASLITISSVFLLLGNDILLQVRLSNAFHLKRIRGRIKVILTPNIILAVGVIVLFLAYHGINPSYYNEIAFLEWYNLSPLQIMVSAAVFVELLYAPAYIIHRIFLRSFNLSIPERLTFYPILSALLLGVLGLIDSFFRIGFLRGEFFILVLSIMLVALLLWDHKSITSHQLLTRWANVNLLEVLGIVAAVAFNLFIFYSAIGEGGAFLRGDMWREVQRVALITKFGLSGYLSSPMKPYPIFYGLFWYVLSEVLPLPYINDLLITAFFNHIFSIIALYTLAKIMFKDSRSALLSVMLWTVLSGFSWIYLMIIPPNWTLFGNQLLGYISLVGARFGMYSGAVFSPINADGTALTRLWSLGLLFASMAALLKGHFSKDQKVGFLLFCAGFIQILLGHIIEALILSLALLALTLIGNKTSKRFIIIEFLTLGALSIIGAVFTTIVSGFKVIYILISFSPVLALASGIILNEVKILAKKIPPGTSAIIRKKLKIVLPIGFMYIFGLMLVTFYSKYGALIIDWPIITIWYYPAVEWGIIGLVSVPALTYLAFENEEWNFGLKFAVALLTLQLALLLFVNYLNYIFPYVYFPYPFEPFLFLPVLALISSQAILTLISSQDFLVRFKKISLKNKQYIVIVLLIILFAIGPLDHVLSASYWKTSNGYLPWPGEPLNPWYPDYQLINFLYLSPNYMPYGLIATFADVSHPESYVVLPTGLSVLYPPLVDILTHTNDSREVYLLTHVYFIEYLLVSRENPPSNESYLGRAIRKVSPVFSNFKYDLYLVSQLNLSPTYLFPSSKDFLTAEKIVFRGALSLVDSINGMICLNNVEGEMHPMGNGEVLIEVGPTNGTKTNITAQTPLISISGNFTMMSMKSTSGYFREIKSSAEQLTIYGGVTFRIFNTFENRTYMEWFTYSGVYSVFPIPSDFLWNYANINKLLIEFYLLINNAGPMKALTNPVGIIWTVLTAIILIVGWTEFYKKKNKLVSTED